ncbi:hypothetical protein EYF80_036452 [Liparis tanakae]|uniref:Uncharacterized protein n=1 Tax=Liparis tanakae TaxID=230148 RepID=A0A4Z2GIF5_9TELE|nr:hypothetical protein EYF80_036452 [Liparis tanakae]
MPNVAEVTGSEKSPPGGDTLTGMHNATTSHHAAALNSPAGISANLPEISLRASAQRDVESAIMLTW